jgi:hypothetical protein
MGFENFRFKREIRCEKNIIVRFFEGAYCIFLRYVVSGAGVERDLLPFQPLFGIWHVTGD